MRIVIAAVGKLKQGPERELAERYLKRAVQTGRGIGLRDIDIIEIRESRAREAERRVNEESIALTTVIPDNAAVVVLDERGESVGSAALSERVRRWRDAGRSEVFVIGGADGIAPALRARADLVLGFGPATWPHQLVRIMLLEQLYRCATILSGHPYHRQ
jgi:23S rRNA (pseudouridine1915-N3)-methyltransferase